MNSISPLTNSMQQIAQASMRGDASMKELGSLRGISEHLLYLFTFGQVDRGRERVEMFTQLMGNLVSLGSRDGALACQFRDPYNENRLIGITIRNNQIHAEVTNTETYKVEASDDLPAPISASHAEMTRLLLELCMAGRKNGTRGGLRVNEGGADLRGAVLCRVDLTGAMLTNANLTGAYLQEADLTRATLVEAQLTNADLTGAHLERANLVRATLEGATLTNADLIEADLESADLPGAHLTGANLTMANLMLANLTEADLRGADLREANLILTDLAEADLRGADLTGAFLAGALLAGAKMSQKNLDWALNSGAEIEGAIICD